MYNYHRGTSPKCLTGTFPPYQRRTPWRRLNDTSLGPRNGRSLRHPKEVSNETPNDVSVVRRQDVLLVQDVLEEYRGDFLRKRNYEVTLFRPYNVKQVLNKKTQWSLKNTSQKCLISVTKYQNLSGYYHKENKQVSSLDFKCRTSIAIKAIICTCFCNYQ